MLAAIKNPSGLTVEENNLKKNTTERNCECYAVIDPKYPHSCRLCKRKISACLYTTELQHKITLQAMEINRLKDELKSSELEIRRQQSDLQTLNTKYVTGIERIADVQNQKDQSDRELEELSARLFEEANNMVADEKRKRIQLEKLLCATKNQLMDERNQLQELKHRMQAISELPLCKPDVKFSSDSLGNSPIPDRQIIKVYTKKPTARLLFSDKQSQEATSASSLVAKDDSGTQCLGTQTLSGNQIATIDPDLNQLKMFRAYIDRYSNILSGKRSSRSPTPSACFDSEDEGSFSSEDNPFDYNFRQPPLSQHSAYIEQCEKEDIEPCLQFGNPDSRMCTKVMMQYMLQTPCFIEAITLEQAKLIPSPVKAISSAYYRPIWERWTASQYYEEGETRLECASCGRKIVIRQNTEQHQLYRFRLDEQDDWLLVDRSCRNRLVAVCNFYSFLRNIQFGHYPNQSFNELYLENIQLRKKIFESRMGIL